MLLDDKLVEKDLERNVWCVLGLIFDNVNMDQAIGTINSACHSGDRLTVCTPNLNFISMAQADPKFRDSVLRSELSLLDGMPILWVAKLLNYPLPERVPGSGLTEKMYNQVGDKLKVFLFGGSAGTAEKASTRTNKHSSGLQVIGHHDPGFVSVEEMSSDPIINEINSCTPDMLLLALGASKAQSWIDLNKTRLNARIIIHVGATMGFLAGTIKRAPDAIQQIGLEWLWRIFEEPSLWQRYAKDGISVGWLFLTRIVPYFFWLRLKERRYTHNPHLGVETDSTPNSFVVKLSGVGICKTLSLFIPVLVEAVRVQKNVQINLSDLVYIDSRFLASFILLRKHVLLGGNTLRLSHIPAHIKRIIYYNCVEFLLSKDVK